MLTNLGLNKVVLALSVARMADAVGNSILLVVIPLYVNALPSPWFHWPEAVRAGFLISVYGLVNVFCQPFIGALSDRLGRRKLFIQSGLLLMGVATLAFILASRFTDLLLLRILQGIGVALTIPASMAIMAGASEKQTRGGSMGFYSTARMSGFAVGPLMGGLFYEHSGFNAAFCGGAFFILMALILVQVLVRESPTIAVIRERQPFRIIDRSLINWGIIGASLSTFMMAAAFSMVAPLETQFNARLHETSVGFGIAFSALIVGRLMLQIPLGRLSDIHGRKPFLIGGLIVLALTTPLIGLSRTTIEFIALRAIQGAGSAAIAAPAFALAADLAKSGGEARQMSIITMGFGLGIALGPLIAGILAIHSFDLPFIFFGAALLVVAWIVQRRVPETVK